jgi:hypothetical protein
MDFSNMSDDEDQPVNLATWMEKGWLCKTPVDANEDNELDLMGSEVIPDDWKKALNSMARKRTDLLLSLTGTDAQVVLLPKTSAVDLPRTLPQLPRKVADHAFEVQACDFVGHLLAPEHQPMLPKLSMPRPVPTSARAFLGKRSDVEADAEAAAKHKDRSKNVTDEMHAVGDGEPRTMMASSRKKNFSQGTLSTVTTGVGSSATDSATTLRSSHKSLPPVPGDAPSLVAKHPAFRGNPAPPRMPPPAHRRPPRGPPLTAR